MTMVTVERILNLITPVCLFWVFYYGLSYLYYLRVGMGYLKRRAHTLLAFSLAIICLDVILCIMAVPGWFMHLLRGY